MNDMATIPDNPVTMTDLMSWYTMQDDLKKLKAMEMLLRKKIFKFYFPNPTEGTNNFALPDDYMLKGVHSIDRQIDEAALVANAEAYKERNIAVADLVRYKPDLVKSAYNKLTEEEKKFFDLALIIKEGSPALTITLPAAKKTK